MQCSSGLARKCQLLLIVSTFTDSLAPFSPFTIELNYLFDLFTLLLVRSLAGVAYSPENPCAGLELMDGNYYIRVRKEWEEEVDMWVQ